MYIIANPTARGGKGGKLTELVTGALKEKGLSYTVARTATALDAALFAKQAADSGEELVLCIGGDGTISQVAGGLVGSSSALGIIPAGTGNDFARYLGVPNDPLKALDDALYGAVREVDAAMANDRIFINSAGSGFDVAVLGHTLRYKKMFRGPLAYILGVLRAVFGTPATHISITHSGGKIEQKALVLSVSNGQYIGGGMRVAPFADASDGLFDVSYVDDLPRWKIPALLAGFIRGDYLGWKVAHHFRCEELTVTTSDSSLQLDGEVLEEKTVRYKILPKAIKIKVPNP